MNNKIITQNYNDCNSFEIIVFFLDIIKVIINKDGKKRDGKDF